MTVPSREKENTISVKKKKEKKIESARSFTRREAACMLVSSAVFSALNRDNVRKTVRGPHFGGGVQVVVPLLPEEKACASLVRFVAFDKKGAFTKWTTNLGSLGLLVHVHGETREEENVHRGTYIERERAKRAASRARLANISRKICVRFRGTRERTCTWRTFCLA